MFSRMIFNLPFFRLYPNPKRFMVAKKVFSFHVSLTITDSYFAELNKKKSSRNNAKFMERIRFYGISVCIPSFKASFSIC